MSIDPKHLSMGRRIEVKTGLTGYSDTGTIIAIHHEEKAVKYLDRYGNEQIALFEELLKIL